jgi:hypothetical protein
MRSIIVLIVSFVSFVGYSQQNLTLLSEVDIPETMKFRGNYLTGVKWEDSLGVNFLLLSQTPVIQPARAIQGDRNFQVMIINGKLDTVYDVKADFKEKEIYAIQYVQTGDSTYLLWKLIDFVRDCSFDLTIDFLNDRPLITDLDKNRICESWLVYWLGCRSDVSALDMKLILHIGSNKYAIRGKRIVRYGSGSGDIDGGQMKADESFSGLPKAINDYALDLWKKYRNENE